MLACPSEVSGWLLEPGRFRPNPSSWLWLPVQSLCPIRYRRYWFGDPTLPLSLPSAVWYSLTGLHWPQLSSSVKSTRRAWPAWEYYPITPSQPTAADQRLSWAFRPYSTWRLEGPLHTGFCLPATFRLQGLATLLTAYSLRNPCRFYFAPTALLGFTLRSFLHPQGTRRVVRTGMNPRTVYLAVDSGYRNTRAGSASRGFWALTPARVPGSQHVFSMPATGCSPGFTPFRATRKSLGRDFAQPPLTRFSTRLAPRRRRLRVSISLCSSSSCPPDLRRTGKGETPS